MPNTPTTGRGFAMPRDDELDDDDYAGFDTAPDDQNCTTDCPHCGAAIYDDAERCPECGKYLSDEDAPRKPLPLWVLIGVAVCILIVIVWMLGR